MSIQYRIQSQNISIFKPDGQTRVRDARKSRWHIWDSHDEVIDNIRDAVASVTRTMLTRHIGGIVVVRPIVGGMSTHNVNKIYQAKWGNDDLPFVRFDGVAGGYWYRQLRKRYPKLINQIDTIARENKQ